MSAHAVREGSQSLWRAHPNDELDVRDALGAANRGEVLSEADSEELLRWLEGNGDATWLDALE
jgi:hypothetical protein